MHHIYHTEAIILGSKNIGEDSKYYILFTRDLGLVYAQARGVRKLSSRLKYVLQDFNYVKLDLIKSKDFWKITTAIKTNFLENITKDYQKIKIIFNISQLLKKLLAGEEKNIPLFNEVFIGFDFIDKMKEKDFLLDVEIVIVLRILNKLGYLGLEENMSSFVNSPFEYEIIQDVSKKKKQILLLINKAINQSHL